MGDGPEDGEAWENCRSSHSVRWAGPADLNGPMVRQILTSKKTISEFAERFPVAGNL